MKLLTFIFLLLFSTACAAPLDGKSPAYFVDRYGPAKSAKTESSHGFIHPGRGSIPIKAQFSAREFRQGDLRVQPVFFLPSLRLAAVRLQLNRAWTPEQIEAALAAYGGEWTAVKHNGIVDTWIAPDGSMAIAMLTWIDIQSKEIVDLVNKAVVAEEALRNAIPKL